MLVDRITAVLEQHDRKGWSSYNDPRYPVRCPAPCNRQFRSDAAHREHVVDQVVEAIQEEA